MGKFLFAGAVAPLVLFVSACASKNDEAEKPEPAAGVARQALAEGTGQIAFATQAMSVPGVFLATGTLGFQPNPTLSFHQFGDRVALADVDNDREDEIVWATQGGSISVFEQTGQQISFPSGSVALSAFSNILAGDLDKDGFDEIVFGAREVSPFSGAISVISRQGHSVGDIFDNGGNDLSFFGEGFDFAVCDLDGDGYDEIITAPNWEIYSHPSLPVLDVNTYFGGSPPEFALYDRVVCADFNADLTDDLLVVRSAQPGGNDEAELQYFTYPGKPPIVYAPQHGQPLFQKNDSIAVGDLTGDGVAEIVTGHVHYLSGSQVPDPFGPLTAYSVQGENISPQIFGQPQAVSYRYGDHVSIRRRHARPVSSPTLDTDGDSLPDVWEGQGPLDGVDVDGDGIGDFKLPNANPYRKDLYVEFDAMSCGVDGSDCAGGDPHQHMPTPSQLSAVVAAFANAPVANACRPDGSCEPDGITLHIEFGEPVPHVNLCDFRSAGSEPTCYERIRNAYFGTPAERAHGTKITDAKALAYRYTLWAHKEAGGALGIADNGVDAMLGMAKDGSPEPNARLDILAQTFMHEFGHNLGLGHGGRDPALGLPETTNHKPNYLSVMNYTFGQVAPPFGILDYSREELPGLNEDNLRETLGLIQAGITRETQWYCPLQIQRIFSAAGGLDWNCDMATTGFPLQADINGDSYCIQSGTGEELLTPRHPNDRIVGGTINPGSDGKCQSCMKCGGRLGDDEIIGEVVYPGMNGVLETQVCALNIDTMVSRIEPNPATRQVMATPNAADVAVYYIIDTNGDGLQTTPSPGDEIFEGMIRPIPPSTVLNTPENRAVGDWRLLRQIQPGSDLVLQSTPSINDRRVPHLIAPGPDGELDSKVERPGIQGDDVPLGGSLVKAVLSGPNGILETHLAEDDVVLNQIIVDGPDRKCDGEVVPPSHPEPTHDDRSFRDWQLPHPALLTGHDDWANLRYQLVPGDREDVAALPKEPTHADFEESARRFSRSDLQISVVPTTGSSPPGSSVSFHVAVTNLGPSTAFAALASVRLPAGVEFSSCSSPSDTCVAIGGVGSLTAAELAPGATVTADFTIQTDCSSVLGSIELAATVRSDSWDIDTGNDFDSAGTTITASAPVFRSIPPDFTTSVCTGVQLGAPSADDGCGASVTLTNNAPTTFPLGRTVVTWTASNGAGSVTATQAVTAILGDSPSCCPAGSRIVLGTPNNDTLNGLAGVDCILGLGAQDTINGNGGNDVLSGGHGNDIINGGDGNDRVYGGTGQDQLFGNNGDDLLEGNDGDDICRGGAGADSLRGGQGQDQLFGEDNHDTLRGDGGSDTLNGGNGNDYLEGSSGTDTCSGGTGVNTFAACENKPDAPNAPNACANGVQDGNETAVDCGGSGCLGCNGGGSCSAGGDCLSQVCSANACLAPTTSLIGSLAITSDWGAGYCATIDALNLGSTSTSNWAVTVDTGQTTIYQSAKASFGGTSGMLQVVPESAQLVIAPGATNSQVNFCANRPAGNTTALPVLVSTAVSY